MVQVILYDVADLRRWQALRAQGVVPEAPWLLLFVLGRYSAGQTSRPQDLLPFLAAHDGGEPWAVCAFGSTEKDRKSTRLNSSHSQISYAVFCLKKKKKRNRSTLKSSAVNYSHTLATLDADLLELYHPPVTAAD